MAAKLKATLLTLLLLCGCSQPAPDGGEGSGTSGTQSAAAGSANGQEETPDTAEKTLPEAEAIILERDGTSARLASWEEAEEYIGNLSGKVVVLDAWSTWCEPCLREYPHLIALQKKFPEKVVCISFNVNYDGSEDSPPESNTEVIEFLAKQKSDLVNLVSSTPDEDFYSLVDLAAVPATFVYGPDGKLARRFDNDAGTYGGDGFTYEEHIVPFVEELIAESAE